MPGHIVGRAAVFCVSLLYFLLLRDYGFQVEDEGTLLFQISRVLEGQRPYIDFHTGYAPGYWALASFLLESVGRDVNALRTVLALVNASTVLLIYEIAGRGVGPWLAVLPALGWAAFIPVAIGDFASFNVPYPAWFATLAWVVVAMAMLLWARSGATGALLVTGLASALAFSVKPNAGAYSLAASAWIVSSLAPRNGGLDRTAAAMAGAFMALGIWAGFGFPLWGVDAAVHLPVVLALACLWTWFPATGVVRPQGKRVTVSLALLGAAFLIPTAMWVYPLLLHLGLERFLSEVLFLASEAAEIYHAPHPAPEFWGTVVAVGALVVGVVGHLLRTGFLGLRSVLLAAVGLLLAALGYLRATALMPEGFSLSVSLQLENAAFLIVPATHIAAIMYLHVARRGRGSRSTRLWLYVVTPLAAGMYLQLYPRTDFMHLLISVPLAAVVATAMLRRVMAWWAGAIGERGGLIVGTGVAAVALLAVVLRVSPVLGPAMLAAAERDRIRIAEGLEVWLEPEASDDLRALARTVAYLERHTGPGEPVMAFPALGAVLFGARLTNPTAHDYWYAGFPDRGAEAEQLERLRVLAPRYVVTLNDGWTWFMDSPPYFMELRDHAVAHYRLEARMGRYDVLGHKDQGVERERVLWAPPEAGTSVLQHVNARRRQAVRRWMAVLAPAEAREATMPPGAGDALLLLRALRDGGDLRALGWLTRGLADPDPRVGKEALCATERVVARYSAAKHRWANDLDATSYFEYLGPHVEAAVELVSRRIAQYGICQRDVAEELRRALTEVSAPWD